MKTLLKILKWMEVVFLCVLLFVLILITVTDYDLRATILNPDFPKDQLAEQKFGDNNDENIYELAANALEEVVVQAFQDEAAESDWGDSADAFVPAIEQVFADTDVAGWMQTEIEAILEQEEDGEKNGLYPYMKSEIDDLEMVIDFKTLKDPFKESLSREIRKVFDEEMEKREQGLPVEIQQLLDLAGTDDAWAVFVEPALNDAYETLDEEMPDQQDISPDEEELEEFDVLRQMVTMANDVFIWLCVICIVITLLLVLLLFTPFKKIPRRVKAILLCLGIVLLLSGVLCVVEAIVVPNQVEQNAEAVDDLADEIVDSLNDLEEDSSTTAISDAVREVVSAETVGDFCRDLLAPMKKVGTILLIIGALFLVGWVTLLFTWKSPKDDEQVLIEEQPEDLKGKPAQLSEEGDEEAGEGDTGDAEGMADEDAGEPSDDSDEDTFQKLTDESPEDKPV